MILYSIAPLVDVLVSHIACAQAGCLRTCKRKVKAKVMHRINDKFHTRGARASANTLLADLNINNWFKVEDHHKSLANGLPMRGGGEASWQLMPRWYRHYQLEGTKGTGRRIQNRRCGVVVVDMEVSGM